MATGFSIRIQKIFLHNFRGFSDFTMEFNTDDETQGMAVLIGENGAGKTSLTDALAIMLQGITDKIAGKENLSLPLKDTDITKNQNYMQCKLYLKCTAPVLVDQDGNEVDDATVEDGTAVLSTEIKPLNSEVELKYSKEGETIDFIVDGEFHRFLKYLETDRKGNEGWNYPVMAYYGVEELNLEEGQKQQPFTSFDKVYKNALKPEKYSFGNFASWFGQLYYQDMNKKATALTEGKNEYDALNKDADNEKLHSILKKMKKTSSSEYSEQVRIVTNAILDMLNNTAEELQDNSKTPQNTYKDLKIDYTDEGGKLFLTKMINGTPQDLCMSQLSDGEKSIIALVGDLARRIIAANVKPDYWINLLKGQGIVLIDEIDLHLHPQWQRNIIWHLQETFKNIQFIITTHSPIVLQSLQKNNKLLQLKDFKAHPLEAPSGQDINDILLEKQGVRERTKSVENKIAEIEDFIDQNKLEMAKKQLAELSKTLPDHDEEIIRLSTDIEFLED